MVAESTQAAAYAKRAQAYGEFTLTRALTEDVIGKFGFTDATGATAALLGEIAIPSAIMRGVAVISRSAGLGGAHCRRDA
ncbi:hypothetical protein GCM10027565_43120 [Bordetella tumulicola]